MQGYIPQVDDGDVLRVVSREYPEEVQGRVLDMLNGYAPNAGGGSRVRLAILRLAKGDLSEIERQVRVAVYDYRDVLAAAEYPRQFKMGFVGMAKLTSEELRNIEDEDHNEYQAWLLR